MFIDSWLEDKIDRPPHEVYYQFRTDFRTMEVLELQTTSERFPRAGIRHFHFHPDAKKYPDPEYADPGSIEIRTLKRVLLNSL